MTRTVWVATAAAMLAPGVLAQSAPAVVNRIQLTAEHNQLDRGLPAWNELALTVSRQWQRRELAEATLTEARRFGQTDTQLEAGYVRPLGPKLTASAQLAFSPSHHFLARYGVGAGAQYEFLPAWLLHARLRHSRYDAATVSQGTLMLERYAGDYSATLAWRPVSALGTVVSGFELRGNRYYKDDSYVGLIASTGQEATLVGAGAIELASVRSLALVGRHRVAPGWSVSYALNRTRQGRFYTRTGLSAGVQHDF